MEYISPEKEAVGGMKLSLWPPLVSLQQVHVLLMLGGLGKMGNRGAWTGQEDLGGAATPGSPLPECLRNLCAFNFTFLPLIGLKDKLLSTLY